MNVLIVEDEPILREAYASIIDWEANGFSLVGSLHNGKAALDFMRQTPVDIVMTDLKMPVMSGLELIKTASQEFPETAFVVMSGFDDFHMVSEAYKLGIKEYFLKAELNPQDVLEKFLSIKEEIEKNRRQKDAAKASVGGAEIQATQYTHSAYREKLLKNLIWDADVQSAGRRLNEYGIAIEERDLCVVLLTMPEYYMAEESIWLGEREFFQYAILNVLDEICQKHGRLYVFCNLPNEFLVICNLENRQTDVLLPFFDEMRVAVRQCFGVEVDGGISGITNRYAELKIAYREAQSACNYCFVTGHGKLNSYRDIEHFGGDVDVTRGVQKFKKLFAGGEADAIRNGALELRISPNDIGFDRVERVKNLFYLYYIEMLNFVEDNNLEKDATTQIEVYDSIQDTADLSAMNNWLMKSIFEIADALACRSGIHKVLHYIKMHYSEPITLSAMAEMLEVSEGHLSRTFQKRVGMSFIQYLIKVRMEMAVQLLQSQNLKIYEVAMRVGYTNADQFSKMFKKIMGKSPKEFQK